jgi:hypothetical protein
MCVPANGLLFNVNLAHWAILFFGGSLSFLETLNSIVVGSPQFITFCAGSSFTGLREHLFYIHRSAA